MLFDRFKNIVKANLNSQFEKLSENDYNVWKTYFEEKERESTHYSDEQIRRDAEAWERQFRQEQEQRYYDPQAEARKNEQKKEAQYYKDLELSPGVSFDEVKKAYRRMVKLYHPDLYQHDPKKQEIAKEVTRKINEAYNYLETKLNK